MSLRRLFERDVKISIKTESSVPKPLTALRNSVQSYSTGDCKRASKSFLKFPDVSLFNASTKSYN